VTTVCFDRWKPLSKKGVVDGLVPGLLSPVQFLKPLTD